MQEVFISYSEGFLSPIIRHDRRVSSVLLSVRRLYIHIIFVAFVAFVAYQAFVAYFVCYSIVH
jgi:hypothetical protein